MALPDTITFVRGTYRGGAALQGQLSCRRPESQGRHNKQRRGECSGSNQHALEHARGSFLVSLLQSCHRYCPRADLLTRPSVCRSRVGYTDLVRWRQQLGPCCCSGDGYSFRSCSGGLYLADARFTGSKRRGWFAPSARRNISAKAATSAARCSQRRRSGRWWHDPSAFFRFGTIDPPATSQIARNRAAGFADTSAHVSTTAGMLNFRGVLCSFAR
jgi:hypothetical protein